MADSELPEWLSSAAPRALTLALLKSAISDDAAEAEDELFRTTSLHLEWLNLNNVDKLDLVSDNLVDLFLQHNALAGPLPSLLGPDLSFRRLEFLSLNGNQITSIGSCLAPITTLKVLDISDNLIERISEGELPLSLRCLNFYGNPFASSDDYRARLVDMLPELFYLDNEDIRDDVDDDDTGENIAESAEATAGGSGLEVGSGGAHESLGESLISTATTATASAAEAKSPGAKSPGSKAMRSLIEADGADISPSKMLEAMNDAALADVEEARERYLTKRSEMMSRFRDRMTQELRRADELTASIASTASAELSSAVASLRSARAMIQERSAARLADTEEAPPTAAAPSAVAATASKTSPSKGGR
jgi:hypothetical protein